VWEVLWKLEVVKDLLNPTWMEARLPLQLLCIDDQANRLKITIWTTKKHSTSHDLIGDTGIASETRKLQWFGGSKLKTVGRLKVLKASVITIPSMLQYQSDGCSLDVMIGTDCTIANGEKGSENGLHYAAPHWLNDYQAGLQKLGTIMEHFSRGKGSNMRGYGAVIKKQVKEIQCMQIPFVWETLLNAYSKSVVDGPESQLGEPAWLTPLIQAAIFRTIWDSQQRHCYDDLGIFNAGKVDDLAETIDLIYDAGRRRSTLHRHYWCGKS
jgi:Copine